MVFLVNQVSLATLAPPAYQDKKDHVDKLVLPVNRVVEEKTEMKVRQEISERKEDRVQRDNRVLKVTPEVVEKQAKRETKDGTDNEVNAANQENRVQLVTMVLLVKLALRATMVPKVLLVDLDPLAHQAKRVILAIVVILDELVLKELTVCPVQLVLLVSWAHLVHLEDYHLIPILTLTRATATRILAAQDSDITTAKRD